MAEATFHIFRVEFIYSFINVFEIGPHVAQAGFKLYVAKDARDFPILLPLAAQC